MQRGERVAERRVGVLRDRGCRTAPSPAPSCETARSRRPMRRVAAEAIETRSRIEPRRVTLAAAPTSPRPAPRAASAARRRRGPAARGPMPSAGSPSTACPTGAATPSASTILSASRQSLCASFIMKPGLKSPASERFGIAIASWLFHAIVVLQHAHHRVERQPGLRARDERLDRRLADGGREQVVEQLHRLPRAELAAVEEVGAHAVEHRPAARDDVRGSADHQRQRPRDRVIGGLADRAVDHRRAFRGHRRADLARRRRIDRAHVDVDAARAGCLRRCRRGRARRARRRARRAAS